MKGLLYRWARVIRKSVTGISTAPVCEAAVAEVLKNLISRFPFSAALEDVQAFENEGGDWRALQLVADLDEPTRLRLAGIFWRWGQISHAVWSKRVCEKYSRPIAPAIQPRSLGVARVRLGSEHAQTIDWFRREFYGGKDATDLGIAGFICECAFLIPHQIKAAISRYIKYRAAEGLDPDEAMRVMIIATQRTAEQEPAE